MLAMPVHLTVIKVSMIFVLFRDRKKYGNDIIPDEAMSDLILHPSGTSVLLMSGLVRLHWDK